MIANGLVKTVIRFVGPHQPNNINELALTVLSNLAIDQPQARQQINELEKEERPTLSDKLSMILEGRQTQETQNQAFILISNLLLQDNIQKIELKRLIVLLCFGIVQS